MAVPYGLSGHRRRRVKVNTGPVLPSQRSQIPTRLLPRHRNHHPARVRSCLDDEVFLLDCALRWCFSSATETSRGFGTIE